MMPTKTEASMWDQEKTGEYDVKQWEKYGKAMEHLSRTLGKLIKTRGETVERIGRGQNDAK